MRLQLACLLICVWSPRLPAADRPNVVFIAVDDLRVDLGCYGSPDVRTPNIDKLAARSLLFRRAYCQQAVCNPSRASLMTGRRPDSLRIWNLPTHFRDRDPGLISLPQCFRQQGYVTQGIGKLFHNWRQKIKGDPAAWSVPEELHFNTHYADDPQVDGEVPPNLERIARNECRDVSDEAYFDGRIAAKAVAAIERLTSRDDPFFLGVGFWKPHLPFNAPKKYWDLFDRDQLTVVQRRKPPENVPSLALHDGKELLNRLGHRPTDEDVRALRHGYVAAIAYLDAQVGKVLDALNKSPAANSTIVVFWSDHGFHLGEHDLWCKTSNFELDARVPLLISVPQMKSAGQSTEALVELIDLYPTLTELANLDSPPGLEGRSLVPVLNHSKFERHAAYTQHPRPAYYKGDLPEVMGYSIRTQRYRYTEWRQMRSGQIVARELYDHKNDDPEHHNVIGDVTHPVENLAEQLRVVFPDRKWTEEAVLTGAP